MKKLILSISAISFLSSAGFAQCTPVNCQATLTYPNLGGVCDTVLTETTVNTLYYDFESFLITDQCFNAQLIDPGNPNTDVKILNIDNFTFSGMPNGITCTTNQSSYNSSGGITPGCMNATGTPTEYGVFNVTIAFLADVQTCGIPINMPDKAAEYVLWFTVKPNASFTGLASNYCITDGAATMTINGTTGGIFQGPGVSGNTFNPATAGVGTHQIQYIVSGQQGAAVGPAADTMTVTVEVFNSGTTFYQDADSDGFGDPNTTTTGCTIPAGYVSNSADCDDADQFINPNESDLTVDGIDQDCNGIDGNGAGLDEMLLSSLVIFPNPTNGNLTVDMSKASIIQSVEVLDINGRIITSQLVNNYTSNLDLSSMPNGIYLVKVNALAGNVVKRISVQH